MNTKSDIQVTKIDSFGKFGTFRKNLISTYQILKQVQWQSTIKEETSLSKIFVLFILPKLFFFYKLIADL